MSNRIIFGMTVLVLLGMAILMFFNLGEVLQPVSKGRYLSHNDIRSIAIVHKGKQYILNFDQQNIFIEYFNNAEPIAHQTFPQVTEPFNFESIIISPFKAPSIEISPIAMVGNDIIFSAPNWVPNGFLRDESQGGLKKLIPQTFDP